MQPNLARTLTLVGAVLLCTTPARAQVMQAAIPKQSPAGTTPVESCIAGRMFGITSYQCPQCNLASPPDSAHVVYSFGSEPIVIATDSPANRIKPGDQIVAVNGNPIMTRAGADQFAYPPPGTATITVRRNNVNLSISQLITGRACPGRSGSVAGADSAPPRAGGVGGGAGMVSTARVGGGGRGGRGSGGGGGGGGAAVRVDSAAVTTGPTSGGAQFDSVRFQRISPDSLRLRGTLIPTQMMRAVQPEIVPIVVVRNFGISLRCQPICERSRTRDGTAMYWRFDGFPLVIVPSATGLAAKAGLRNDDVLITVNGKSPQVEEGALILNRAERELTLRLEISRDGKRQKITLKL